MTSSPNCSTIMHCRTRSRGAPALEARGVTRSSRWPALATGVSLALIAVLLADAGAPVPPDAPRSLNIYVTTDRIVRRARRGARGSVRWSISATSTTKPWTSFGEISALRIGADGQSFISLNDNGRWVSRPHRLSRPEETVGDRRRGDRPQFWDLTAHRWRGAAGATRKSIAEDGGTLYVGIERVNKILRFNYAEDGLTARGQPVDVPAGVKSLPFNQGLETLLAAPRGHRLHGVLIAISERGLDSRGNIAGFLIGGSQPGQFSVRRTDDYDITDAAFLPGGDLVILERRFSLARGVATRLRRIAQSTVRARRDPRRSDPDGSGYGLPDRQYGGPGGASQPQRAIPS